MSAIRPNLPDLQQRPFAGADTARGAQAAFFQAAMAQSAVSQTAQASMARPAAPVDTPVRSVPARSPLFPDHPTPAPASERPLRPGALLDIRV